MNIELNSLDNNQSSLFSSLNKEQQEAVFETEGYVRVIAGLGSEKTRVLTNRFI